MSTRFCAPLASHALLALATGLWLFVQGCYVTTSPSQPASNPPTPNTVGNSPGPVPMPSEPPNACGPYGQPWRVPATVVKTTVAPNGTVIDWVYYSPSLPLPPAPPPGVLQPGIAPASVPAPGTLIPYPRPRQLRCVCQPGYRARPGEPCVADPIPTIIPRPY